MQYNNRLYPGAAALLAAALLASCAQIPASQAAAGELPEQPDAPTVAQEGSVADRLEELREERYREQTGTHTIAGSVAEGLPALTLEFQYRYRGPEDIAVTVEVRQEEALLQTLAFTCDTDFLGADRLVYAYIPTWRLVDLNFDGYLDLLCLDTVGGAKANHFYSGWLYNPQTGLFEEAPAIGGIFNLAVDGEAQVLRSVVSGSANSSTYSIYRYIDGDFQLTNELTVEPDWRDPQGDALHYREYGLKDGRLELIGDVARTDQNAQELWERYHQAGTLWALDTGVFYTGAATPEQDPPTPPDTEE